MSSRTRNQSDPRDIAKPHGFDLTVLKRHLRPSNLGQSGAGTVACRGISRAESNGGQLPSGRADDWG